MMRLAAIVLTITAVAVVALQIVGGTLPIMADRPDDASLVSIVSTDGGTGEGPAGK